MEYATTHILKQVRGILQDKIISFKVSTNTSNIYFNTEQNAFLLCHLTNQICSL